MYVKIVGFKCHLDSEYTFDSESMVLLRGESGAGKSTILQAIFWAMYGLMRNVYNNSGQIKTCSVTLQINHLIIYRQKKPELLQVTITNPKDGSQNVYEDEVAQQIIDSAFGPKDLWKSCSYVNQKERCALLSGTANERLTLLNQLSFDQDNPKDYIDIIDTKLKEINVEFTNAQANFTAELDLFTKQLNTRPATKPLSDDEIIILKNDINNLTIEIQQLYNDVLTHERNIGSYNIISNQLSQVETQLLGIPEVIFDETQYNLKCNVINETISRLKEQGTLIRHYTNIKSRSEKLQSDINKIRSEIITIDNNIATLNNQLILSQNNISERSQENTINLNSNIKVDQQYIWNVIQQENQLKQFQNECNQLGCEYDQNSINNLINTYQSELNNITNIQRNLQTYNQLKTLRAHLVQYSSFILTNEKISELENINIKTSLEISELKKGLELLQCPNCSVSLRHVGTKLIQGERDPVNPIEVQQKETEYKSILDQINKIRTGINIQSQIDNIENQLKGIDLNALENFQTRNNPRPNYQGLIGRLMRIQIIQLPQYSSSYLQSILNHQQLISQSTIFEKQKYNLMTNLNQLEDQLKTIEIPNVPSHDLGLLQKEINTHELELNKLNQNKQQSIQQKSIRDNLITTITNLKQQQNSVLMLLKPNSKTLYETTKTLLETTKTKLLEGEYTNSIISQQKQLEIKRAHVMKLNDDISTLQRLKQNAINVECKQLQDTVDTINQALSDILPLFFNEPIDMVLQLYKTLKSKKETKPGLNIIIKHKGTEYDNINQLSGGEGDRISLALVLALNQVSNSPIIMLDECVSSLDGALKESCIKAMKDMTGKTIICVDHEGVEGYYDKTILVSH